MLVLLFEEGLQAHGRHLLITKILLFFYLLTDFIHNPASFPNLKHSVGIYFYELCFCFTNSATMFAKTVIASASAFFPFQYSF